MFKTLDNYLNLCALVAPADDSAVTAAPLVKLDVAAAFSGRSGRATSEPTPANLAVAAALLRL